MNIVRNVNVILNQDDNEELAKIPSEEEIKNVVFSMDPNSSPGPDGFNGQFYQTCWEIIIIDVCNFVRAVFGGAYLTKFFTHTNLILIPKMTSPTTLSQLRPISLCNFSSKIISKVLTMRIAPMLPQLISENQTGFVKGRQITENILLTQEIVHGIKNASV